MEKDNGSSKNDVTQIWDNFGHTSPPSSRFLLLRPYYCRHKIIDPLPIDRGVIYGLTLNCFTHVRKTVFKLKTVKLFEKSRPEQLTDFAFTFSPSDGNIRFSDDNFRFVVKSEFGA